MKSIFFISLLIFFLPLDISLNEKSRAPSSLTSVINPHELWPKTKVSVCFARSKTDLNDTKLALDEGESIETIVVGSLDQKLKNNIKNIVHKNFNFKDTGIEFIGFKNCRSKIQSDIVVFLEESSSKALLEVAEVGRLRNSLKNSLRINRAFLDSYKKTLDDYKNAFTKISQLEYKSNALEKKIYSMFLKKITHEFGHLAGLYHEHTQDQSMFWLNLLAPKEIPRLEKEFLAFKDYQKSITLTYVGEFQLFSLMNYATFYAEDLCLLAWMICEEVPHKLSPSDRLRICQKNLYNSFLSDSQDKFISPIEAMVLKNYYTQANYQLVIIDEDTKISYLLEIKELFEAMGVLTLD